MTRRVLLLCLALLLSWPTGLHAQQGSPGQREFDLASLDILLARGVIDQPTYAELLALAEAHALEEQDEQRDVDILRDQLDRLRAPEVETYGERIDSLRWESSDGRWSVGLAGRIQTRVDVVEGDSRSQDSRNCMIRRGRLIFAGRAGAWC